MAERDALARRVLHDLELGMEDAELMEKHKLSPEQLQELFAELVAAGLLEGRQGRHAVPAARRINVEQLVTDIRSGMTGYQLMEKYELSSKAFQDALRNLVDTGVLDLGELSQELLLRHGASAPEDVRQLRRYYLDFELPILDAGPPRAVGRIRDMAEGGVGVIGISAKTNDVKTLHVFHEKFVLIKPFSFEAECRWAKSGKLAQESLAGFQITNISEQDALEMRKLIRLVTIFG